MGQPALARDRVRHVGEPIAVVVAETARQAVDAAEQIWVDFETLPAVTDVPTALEDQTLLFPESGTNLVHDETVGSEGSAPSYQVEAKVEIDIPRRITADYRAADHPRQAERGRPRSVVRSSSARPTSATSSGSW